MIPAQLTAPIDYESFYSSANTDEVQRFSALNVMINRLKEVGWLSDRIHSVNLIDWDWRSESRKYNHRHVPMIILTEEIFDWYRNYGIFVHQAFEERAQRFSLARFFFELTPRRDLVVIRFDLKGKYFFKVERKVRARIETDQAEDPGAVFTPEIVTIHVNQSLAMEVCRPLHGLLDEFRSQYPLKHRPKSGDIISLADTISNLEEPVRNLLATSEKAKAAGEAYVKFPDRAFETMGQYPERLIHGSGLLLQELESKETSRDIRILLSNLAVQAFLVPDSMRDSRIAIVPGIAQIEDGKPMAAGGFLLHYTGDKPGIPLNSWLQLVTSWAREKATFDLAIRARAQEQRRSLAYANHALKIPLTGLKRLIRHLPETSDGSRQSLLWSVNQLLDLESFVKLISKGKMEQLVTATAEDFLKDFRDALAVLCSILEDSKGDYADMVVRISPNRSLFITIYQDDDSIKCWEKLSFSPRQMRAVLDGLLTNALKYNIPGQAAYIRVWLSRDGRGVYLNVQNACGMPEQEARQLAGQLTQRPDTDWIGVYLLHAATEACESYRLPQWEWRSEDGRAMGSLRAKVQIAITDGEDK